MFDKLTRLNKFLLNGIDKSDRHEYNYMTNKYNHYIHDKDCDEKKTAENKQREPAVGVRRCYFGCI